MNPKLKRITVYLLVLALLAGIPATGLAQSTPIPTMVDLNALINLSATTVNVGQAITVSWEVRGGTNPEIAFTAWRTYDAAGNLINEDRTTNLKALQGSTNYAVRFGAKGEFYMEIADQTGPTRGFVSYRYTITGDTAPLDGTINLDKTSVAQNSPIKATWSVTGSRSPKILLAEWLLLNVDGSEYSRRVDTAITALTGTVNFSPPGGATGQLRLTITDATGLTKQVLSPTFNITQDGWRLIDGEYYYYIAGVRQYRMITIGKESYYLEPFTGRMLTGWITDGGYTYYFNPTADMKDRGKMYKEAWHTEGGNTFYFLANGVMATNTTVLIKNEYHYFNAAGVWQGLVPPQTGWFQKDNKWFYNEGGVIKTGWLKLGTTYYYLSPADGSRHSGWLDLAGKRYFFDSAGVMVTGSYVVDVKHHLFDSTGAWLGQQAAAYTGWLKDGGEWMYFKANVKQTGWLTIGTAWYYLKPANGAMAIGWLQVGANWYHFGKNGVMTTGWHEEAGFKYYFRPADGTMVVGTLVLENTSYTFNAKGQLTGSTPITDGWRQVGSNWYYYRGTVLQKGWVKVGTTWYYLRPTDGLMLTGWQQVGGLWYYLRANGAMATGWLQLGSTWYYLQSSGAMATGSLVIEGKTHTFNAAGAWQGSQQVAADGWKQEGGQWYYYRSGLKATGWIQAGGAWYYLKTNGAMATGWTQVNGTWYYLRANGAMATGWLQLGGTWYYLAGSGAMVTGNYTIGGVVHRFATNGTWLGS